MSVDCISPLGKEGVPKIVDIPQPGETILTQQSTNSANVNNELFTQLGEVDSIELKKGSKQRMSIGVFQLDHRYDVQFLCWEQRQENEIWVPKNNASFHSKLVFYHKTNAVQNPPVTLSVKPEGVGICYLPYQNARGNKFRVGFSTSPNFTREKAITLRLDYQGLCKDLLVNFKKNKQQHQLNVSSLLNSSNISVPHVHSPTTSRHNSSNCNSTLSSEESSNFNETLHDTDSLSSSSSSLHPDTGSLYNNNNTDNNNNHNNNNNRISLSSSQIIPPAESPILNTGSSPSLSRSSSTSPIIPHSTPIMLSPSRSNDYLDDIAKKRSHERVEVVIGADHTLLASPTKKRNFQENSSPSSMEITSIALNNNNSKTSGAFKLLSDECLQSDDNILIPKKFTMIVDNEELLRLIFRFVPHSCWSNLLLTCKNWLYVGTEVFSSSLPTACERGYPEVVNYLLAVKKVDPSGDLQAMRLALINGHVEVAKILFQHPRVEQNPKAIAEVLEIAREVENEEIELLALAKKVLEFSSSPSLLLSKNSAAISRKKKQGLLGKKGNSSWKTSSAPPSNFPKPHQILQESHRDLLRISTGSVDIVENSNNSNNNNSSGGHNDELVSNFLNFLSNVNGDSPKAENSQNPAEEQQRLLAFGNNNNNNNMNNDNNDNNNNMMGPKRPAGMYMTKSGKTKRLDGDVIEAVHKASEFVKRMNRCKQLDAIILHLLISAPGFKSIHWHLNNEDVVMKSRSKVEGALFELFLVAGIPREEKTVASWLRKQLKLKHRKCEDATTYAPRNSKWFKPGMAISEIRPPSSRK